LGLGTYLLHATKSATVTGMMYNPIDISAAKLNNANNQVSAHAIRTAPRHAPFLSAAQTARVTSNGMLRTKTTCNPFSATKVADPWETTTEEGALPDEDAGEEETLNDEYIGTTNPATMIAAL
jgi:hypothetical protein